MEYELIQRLQFMGDLTALLQIEGQRQLIYNVMGFIDIRSFFCKVVVIDSFDSFCSSICFLASTRSIGRASSKTILVMMS